MQGRKMCSYIIASYILIIIFRLMGALKAGLRCSQNLLSLSTPITRYFPHRQSSLLFYWQRTRFNIIRHRKCWLIFNKDNYNKDLWWILCALFNIYFLASHKMRGPVIYEQFCISSHLPHQTPNKILFFKSSS